MSELKLQRPIVFFDTETTGTSVANDRIVQLAMIKIYPDGREEELEWMFNPGCSIPPDATAVHGISDEDVMFSPPFSELAYDIVGALKGCDLAGYNGIKFDVPLLINELKRAGSNLSLEGVNIVDPFVIYKNMESRNLSKAYEYYCGGKFDGAHTAMADTRATVDVFKAQLKKYDDLPKTTAELAEFCKKNPNRHPDAFDDEGKLIWQEGELAINFGKYKGRTLKYLMMENRGYLEWLLGKDFSDPFKQAIQKTLRGELLKR